MLKSKVLKATLLYRLQKKGVIELPSPEVIKFELLEMFKTLLINEERKSQILAMSPEIQWKLVQNHKKFQEKNQADLKTVNVHEIMSMVEKLKGKLSIIDLNELKRWFLQATSFQVKSFCIYDGIKYLLTKLSEEELSGRKTKNYRKQISKYKATE